ncbi:MAG: type II secretion system F family protein, partial [Candidatus Diapherotrites archaeon]|nr:type II secretion system F family protein [Candidatus Diapherotrites archaeon]
MPDEKQEKKKPMFGQEKEEKQTVDIDKVESIVARMKQKYSSEGVDKQQMTGKLGELRGIITEGKAAALKIQTVDSLRDSKSGSVKTLADVYKSGESVFKPLSGILSKLPLVGQLEYYMFSANMKFSSVQYLAITTVVSFIIALILGILTIVVLPFIVPTFIKANPLFPFLLGIFVALFGFFAVAILILMVPQAQAKARGEAINIELPFALRHMGTELRSGIGLYKTLQTIAVADYGVLSEEFARTINEIEEGTDAKDA